MRILPIGLLCLVMIPVLGACADSPAEKPVAVSEKTDADATTAPTGGSDTTEATPTWVLDADVIGQPTVQDDVAVVLARAPAGRLDVLAVDALTGEKLWDRPWSPGAVDTGYGMEATVVTLPDGDGRVVLSEPEVGSAEEIERWTESLVGVDLRTGVERFRTAPVFLVTPLQACADEAGVCFELAERDGGAQRLDPMTGALGPDPGSPPEGARAIGPDGLYATHDRPGERIGVQRDGATLWEADIETVVGPGASTDNGWSFRHDDAEDVFIGSVGQWSDPRLDAKALAGEPFVAPVKSSRLVGIDGATGAQMWTRDDATQDCLNVSAVQDVTPALRCVITGEVAHNGDTAAHEKLAVTVEGFDPMTGATLWSVELSDAGVETVMARTSTVVSDGRSVLLDAVDGHVLVDVASGVVSPLEGDEVFACAGDRVEVDYAVPSFLTIDPETTRYGGTLVTPCTADGSPAEPMTVSTVRDGGVPAGEDHYVVAVEGALHGYAIDS